MTRPRERVAPSSGHTYSYNAMVDDHSPRSQYATELLNVEGRGRLAHRLRRALTDVLEAWFPRTLDREHGGFLCDFDYRWRPTGPHRKMLEFQARETRVAALAAEFLPDRRHLRECADHGFAFLRDTMWDGEFGGWYRMLDREGRPLEGRTKHGHGTSYAIAACVAHYQLTGDETALDLAKRAFAWLEEFAHDPVNEGYHVFYQRDGRPIMDALDSPAEFAVRDAIGTPLGCKDANTTCDLMKALAVLYGAWPDAVVRERLSELFRIVRDRLVVAPGSVHMYCHADWTPIPHFAHYGQTLHTGNLLRAAARVLDLSEDERTRDVLRSIVDWALGYAWDSETGGFLFAGSTFGDTYLEDQVISLSVKYWWIQAEGLELLLPLALTHSEDQAKYADHFLRLWRYVERYVIDSSHGGWRWKGLDAGRKARKLPKATEWKDPSHEAGALMECIRLLESGDNAGEAAHR